LPKFSRERKWNERVYLFKKIKMVEIDETYFHAHFVL
jgi:hypothetical protein